MLNDSRSLDGKRFVETFPRGGEIAVEDVVGTKIPQKEGRRFFLLHRTTGHNRLFVILLGPRKIFALVGEHR